MSKYLDIRPAKTPDINAINDIYNHYVINSICTFQTEPETVESRTAWFEAHGERYPVFVAEIDGEVVGWASLSKYHPGSSAWHTVEDSVYIRHDMTGKGIGKVLLMNLILEARCLGYHSIMAGIASDQIASLKLHEDFGFMEAGHLREIGYKLDRWIDVKLLQLLL
ncbi:N-acetyltransferase [Methanocella sp. CWC-04]|uniref:N-acetyltransferase n=1 Tax=Methanooceanicella nereidis TaxID=2052831 RepID=A0AAP2RBS1_9EURY|nr:GNAT family N-acetyltransferase [Methanocella sp. CWC-04]MCD1294157.1 N-acetyltransferase [Methanocella sp. CWC-04]